MAVFGDFNEILSKTEKQESRERLEKRMDEFRQAMND